MNSLNPKERLELAQVICEIIENEPMIIGDINFLLRGHTIYETFELDKILELKSKTEKLQDENDNMHSQMDDMAIELIMSRCSN